MNKKIILFSAFALISPAAVFAETYHDHSPAALEKSAVGFSASALEERGAASMASEVQEGSHNGIRFINGGIGKESREQMRLMKNRFNLHLELADATSGAYLSGATVTVTDKKGDIVLQETGIGPFFMAALPADTYKVHASMDNHSQNRKVTLKSRHEPVKLVMSWKTD